jgi:cbb3-type cytochrome oxidase subunit 3
MNNETPESEMLKHAGAMSRASYAPTQEQFRTARRRLTVVLSLSLIAFLVPVTAMWDTLREAAPPWALASLFAGFCGLLWSVYLTGKFGNLDKEQTNQSESGR